LNCLFEVKKNCDFSFDVSNHTSIITLLEINTRVNVAKMSKCGKNEAEVKRYFVAFWNTRVNVAKMSKCGKNEAEVKRYFVAFWTNYQKVGDWKKIIERIERGEKINSTARVIRELIQYKVEDLVEKAIGEEAVTEIM